jgi:ribosome-associated protein
MTVKRKSSSASNSTSIKGQAKAPPKGKNNGSRSAAGKHPPRLSSPRSARSTAVKSPAAKTARKSAKILVHTPKVKPAPAAILPPKVVGVIEHALGEMKAANVKVLDVHELTDIADTLVIASGNSDRHVRAIADRVVEEAKKSGFRPMGVEGERDGEWVLVDLQDVIVHIMLPRVREFYRLESLWDVSAARREAVQSA